MNRGRGVGDLSMLFVTLFECLPVEHREKGEKGPGIGRSHSGEGEGAPVVCCWSYLMQPSRYNSAPFRRLRSCVSHREHLEVCRWAG